MSIKSRTNISFAIVIGLAAAGLPKEQRARVIGIVAATVMRIGFAEMTNAAIADHRTAFCRGSAAALGMLEDVA